MAMETKKYQVNCPISNRPEFVYVHTVKGIDARLADFNGCDNSYHRCKECDEICQAKARQLFSQEYGEELRVLWRTP